MVGTTDDPERRQKGLRELDQAMPDLVPGVRRVDVVDARSPVTGNTTVGVAGVSCGRTDSYDLPEYGTRGRARAL